MLRHTEPSSTIDRMLFIINSFRAAVVIILIVGASTRENYGQPLVSGAWFFAWIASYSSFIAISYLLPKKWLYHPKWTAFSSLIDIAMIVCLMYLAGGVRSGYGLLLFPFLAMASLPVSGRYAVFYASFASVCLFAGFIFDVDNTANSADFFQTALIAIVCFVVSLVTLQLAQTARKASSLAKARGNEIANLNRLNALALQGLSEAVIVLSNDGRVAQFNLTAKRYFQDIKHGAVLDSVRPLLDLWRKQPRMPLIVEQQIGKIRLNGRLVPVVDGNDAVLVLFLRDAADIAESALRSKLAALGRLTANIAHEIRNPLSAINHAADLLCEQITSPTDQRLAQMICNNAKRIDRLVEEVLALNRRDRIKPEIFNFKDWLEEFMHEFLLANPDIPQDGVRLEQCNNLFIRFDRGHLHQIVWNLTANAWRHSLKTKASVSLELATRNEYLLYLEVRDDGSGVTEEQQAKLFEPFFTTIRSGTGLGLYIARELAEANGARLEYRPPGGCFRLTCRLIKPQMPSAE